LRFSGGFSEASAVAVERIKSGFYHSNKMVRIYLLAIREILGPEAMRAVLNLAELPEVIDNYPPDNMAREFDFADFSAIGAALEKMYGMRGERGVGLHAGKNCFTQGLNEFGSALGINEIALKSMPLNIKLKIGLKAITEAFKRFSDRLTSFEETDEHFVYTIQRCPICWDRTSQKPVCYLATGLLQAGLQWFGGGQEFEVVEVACHAVGDEACVFHIRKEPLSG
jgi:predicted hydrocarbon binding protein